MFETLYYENIGRSCPVPSVGLVEGDVPLMSIGGWYSADIAQYDEEHEGYAQVTQLVTARALGIEGWS